MWVSEAEVEETSDAKLNERYEQARVIDGTLGFHSFRPVPGTHQLAVKRVSSDTEEVIKNTTK